MPYLTIDLRGLDSGDAEVVKVARKQLAEHFDGDIDRMRRYYGWREDAPVLFKLGDTAPIERAVGVVNEWKPDFTRDI